MEIGFIIVAIVCLFVGLGVGYFLGNKDKKQMEERLKEQNQLHKEAKDDQERRFDEMMKRMAAQMQTATNEMLKQSQQDFTITSSTSIGQIVNPLRETIDKMKAAMQENNGRLQANVEQIKQLSGAMTNSADELTRVLKREPHIQGGWGERVLSELLHSQGLTEGIHYDLQATIRDANGNTIRDDEGHRLRPDAILHLDQQREVIIDSKVSLTAFFDYVNANDETARRNALQKHINSIEKHINELANKDYSSYIQPPKVKMDYVIMFVPNTAALWTALNVQPDLWRKAMDKNVYIADEQTLYAALRIIDLTWRQIKQAQNHEQVFKLAEEMLNRVGQFWEAYEKIGNKLNDAIQAYEQGRKKITDGGQSINTTARNLIDLGARQNERHPLPQTDNNMQVLEPFQNEKVN